MQSLVQRDYFTDHEILKDPVAYFEATRQGGPIFQPPGRDYYVVTGFNETLEVLRDHDTFSAIISLQGAGAPLPFTPKGSDLNEQIEAHRKEFLGWDQVVNMDDDRHTKLRSLANTFFVPSRLKASEEFIDEYSRNMVDRAVARGKVELIGAIATPFVTMVVADLLGVPVQDRQIFMDAIADAPPPGSLDGDHAIDTPTSPLMIMAKYFYEYVADRRANPREDILTELANSRYADGSAPEVHDIVQLAMLMFGAGQDTSAKLIGNAMRYLVACPALQDDLRANSSRIPDFLEEVLRIEGSVKQTARLARKDTEIGGLRIPAGSKLLVSLLGANRDPRRWERPDELILGRPKIKEHLAFGRGKHVCAGAALARAEVRILMEKFLARTIRIELDSDKHPDGADELSYEPSFIIRGLSQMHLNLIGAPN